MVTNLKKYILLLLLILSISTFGQKGFEKISEVDGVVFYGKWSLTKKSNKESPLILCIIAHNTNNYAVDCNFVITFYDAGIVAESSELFNLCIKPNKKAKGKKKGLCLLSAELTNEQIKSDLFTVEINQTVISKTETCKKQVKK